MTLWCKFEQNPIKDKDLSYDAGKMENIFEILTLWNDYKSWCKNLLHIIAYDKSKSSS